MIRCTTYHRSGTRSRAAEYARPVGMVLPIGIHDHPRRGLVKITKRPCLTARSWPATRTGHPNFARLHVRRTRPGTIHLRVRPTCAQRPRSSSADAHEAPGMPEDLLERFGCPAISLSEPF